MWILFENGKYTIPYDDRCRKKVDILVNELRGMAWDRGRVVSTSEHKDMVMSMWLAELGIGERSTINKVFDNQVLVTFILVIWPEGFILRLLDENSKGKMLRICDLFCHS